MRIMLNEELENGAKMIWSADVSVAEKPENGYEDWAIMEALDMIEEEDEDWSQVSFWRIDKLLDRPVDGEIKASLREWGPRGEVYDLKVGDVLTVLNEEYLMINDFTVEVELAA